VTLPWAFGGPLVSQGLAGHTTLMEGSTFCISEPGGDIRAGHTQGLFVRGIRVLSRWELIVDVWGLNTRIRCLACGLAGGLRRADATVVVMFWRLMYAVTGVWWT
jgi:hypothetical protein